MRLCFSLFFRSVTEEEREAKYVRMLTSALLGVKRLLSLLPQDDRTALEQRLAHLVTSGKFWKYSKHKTPQVTTLNRTALLITGWNVFACNKAILEIFT